MNDNKYKQRLNTFNVPIYSYFNKYYNEVQSSLLVITIRPDRV